MKMAKASQADINMAMDLTTALEGLTGWGPTVPNEAQKKGTSEEGEPFDRDDREQCVRVLNHLMDVSERGSLMRVVWGCAVMLDPNNMCVDPEADTLEHHPAAIAGAAARTPKPLADWTSEKGDVLWWSFNETSKPYLGTPLDATWPGTHTHWTALITPAAPETVPLPETTSTTVAV